MKYINLYPTVDKVKEQLIETPNVIGIEGSDKVFYFPASAGKETIPLDDGNGGITYDPYFYQMSQFKGPHGGIFAVFDFTGKNQRIGGTTLYSELDTLYLDGEVFDIEDLIITVGGGSGSGSGSGSYGGASGIAMPSSITGVHTIEYCLAVDTLEGSGWFQDCTGLIGISFMAYCPDFTSFFKNTSLESFYYGQNKYLPLEEAAIPVSKILPNGGILGIGHKVTWDKVPPTVTLVLCSYITVDEWYSYINVKNMYVTSNSGYLYMDRFVYHSSGEKIWAKFILDGAILPKDVDITHTDLGKVCIFVTYNPTITYQGTTAECIAKFTTSWFGQYHRTGDSTKIIMKCTDGTVTYTGSYKTWTYTIS